MQMQQTNLLLVYTLDQWDPFGVGPGNYDTEIADSIQAVHDLDDQVELARAIQSIYEFSFEEIIPLENCKEISGRLLEIKNNGFCAM
ncbi:hypothetical protein ABE29_01895 [Cytobacillus firmus]|uniref:Uncharacterized protein n=2 Tax=Cytobacillus firmus TaxID=1399 RepID=A0A380Y2G1_CYTFI|nr:DUF1871 family protein [Cytobacillus firmus]KAF0824253.1 hypothetical protein KIS1582_1932 [Cytobacillus firmus]MBG9541597.1 hypothetical protein [Cytobacillus firmus]MBG9555021.1 hypothetical protein [Cytobacillus firmus]MBG9558393.1 hypothetical protein [Cytobacillus firmus]MBG9573692.1 hypothetical protein [Cytobacillus firmus]